MRRIYILVLFLILVEMFSVFLHLGGCTLWHSFMLPLLYLDMSTVSLLFPGLLSWMDIGFCQKAFSISNEIILCFVSSFYLHGGLYLLIYICWTTTEPLTWSSLAMMDSRLYVYLQWFSNILCSFFHLISPCCPKALFFVKSFVWFCYQGNNVFIK